MKNNNICDPTPYIKPRPFTNQNKNKFSHWLILAHAQTQRRETQAQYGDLDEEAKDILGDNAVEREKLAREIAEMRARSVSRICLYAQCLYLIYHF